MSDALRRGVRTLLWFVLAAIPVVPAGAALFNMSGEKATQLAAFLTVVGAALTGVINAAEDAGLVPALLKAPASDGENPVPDEKGYTEVGLALVVLVVIVIVLLLTDKI